MKITREQPQFTPVTIVLETKDEADLLYGLLNINNPDQIYNRVNKYNKFRIDMLEKLYGVLK